MDVAAQIQSLIFKMQHLEQKVALLTKEVGILKMENTALRKENTTLQSEVSRYKNKKNSGNSHLPPSKDENRPAKNQSLRHKSGNKPGGQAGHEGNTLAYTATPDEVIRHLPAYCRRCGHDLRLIPEALTESRRVIDLPVIRPVCTEHRTYRKVCPCGHCTESDFPAGVTAPLQYGAGIQALTGYMHARQMMPYKRMQEFFTHVLNLPLSTGSIYNMLQKITQKATPLYQQIKERISRATTIGADETGAKVNGKKSWMWTWQNEELTFIAHSDNRAQSTIEKLFPNGFPNAVLQHDRYAAHFNCKAAAHQICTAHLLRDLQYTQELYPECDWSNKMKNLILQAIELKRNLTKAEYYTRLSERTNMQLRLNELLEQDIGSEYKKAVTLQKSLRKHSNALLTFLYHPKVPPDNNGSERAIRNIKVKQKVSGQFKSDSGANAFAVLRSILDTAIKNGKDALTALSLIANLEAE